MKRLNRNHQRFGRIRSFDLRHTGPAVNSQGEVFQLPYLLFVHY